MNPTTHQAIVLHEVLRQLQSTGFLTKFLLILLYIYIYIYIYKKCLTIFILASYLSIGVAFLLKLL